MQSAQPSGPRKPPALRPKLPPMRDSNSAAVSRGTAGNPVAQSERVPPKVYAVMALTTTLTFAALTTGYELLFTHQLYA